MKRLLIIGSREFILGAADFATDYAPGLSVVGLMDSTTDIAEDVEQTRPDIILLDGVSNLTRALSCLPDLRAQAPSALLVVVVDQSDHKDTTRALDAGALVCARPPHMRGWSQDARPDPWRGRLRSLIGPVLGAGEDKPVLTRREHEIMEWVASGHTNASIARSLWVTEQTIKFHLTNIYRKLNVANRTEASHYVLQQGLVSPPDAHEPAGADVRPVTLVPVADASVVGG